MTKKVYPHVRQLTIFYTRPYRPSVSVSREFGRSIISFERVTHYYIRYIYAPKSTRVRHPGPFIARWPQWFNASGNTSIIKFTIFRSCLASVCITVPQSRDTAFLFAFLLLYYTRVEVGRHINYPFGAACVYRLNC